MPLCGKAPSCRQVIRRHAATLKSSRHLSIFGYDADEPHAALVDDVIEVAQAAGVFPPGGKTAEIFGVKTIDDKPLLRYLKLC